MGSGQKVQLTALLILVAVSVSIGFIVWGGLNSSDTEQVLEQRSKTVTPHSSELQPELQLWPPSRVDADQLALMFTLAVASGQGGQPPEQQPAPLTYTAKLEYQLDGEAVYRPATLVNQDQQGSTYTVNRGAGASRYRLVWDKKADQVPLLAKVNLRLTVTPSEKGASVSAVMNNLQPETREALRVKTDAYLIHYGKWTEELLRIAKEHYKLVILDTRSGITPEQIAQLRSGKDRSDAADDVLVLAYVSVGEDLRTVGMTPEQMKMDARFVLDGTGPSVDPRKGAPFPNGAPLTGQIPLAGKPTNGGFAPFYLNDNYVTNGFGAAGVPDFNTNFKAAFVNPGHPQWFEALQAMTLDHDKVSGIRELLTYEHGRGFGCDGLFMDTLDTAAPNSFTDASSANQGEFEWVAGGTRKLVSSIREAYPQSLLLANRGLFFYHPDLETYRHTLRGLIDYVLYESFRLDSSAAHDYSETIFADNKYNYAQKVLAEADRPDGFRVLSLGYAEGPDGVLLRKALHGEAGGKPHTLLDDLNEVSALGMVHYLSNGAVSDVNTFTLDHRPSIGEAPKWGSTETPLFAQPYRAPREGLQRVERRGKDVYVQWDVAHAPSRPVRYTLYVKEGATFDMTRSLAEQSVKTQQLEPTMPQAYVGAGERTQRFPYEAKVEGLVSGRTYYMVLRASSASGQSDSNERVVQVKAP
ncbi:hypothetical protein [Paenibacillus sp. YYML68]|uniref:hypothetical protein n=1 Tax=Paenibacillus sp. YYML68 TaxID=2909250 RepID=UPI0024939028|nr:hypothetical protein [Paenibacillus sp. YYML68]